jgi:hypothetical protein
MEKPATFVAIPKEVPGSNGVTKFDGRSIPGLPVLTKCEMLLPKHKVACRILAVGKSHTLCPDTGTKPHARTVSPNPNLAWTRLPSQLFSRVAGV